MGAGLSKKEEGMKCVICKHGTMQPGTATVTLTRQALTLVIKDVPALVCDNCGEEYVEEPIAKQLLKAAEEAAAAGVQVDVRQYVAA
jgi:YgiT-type zinc finger domain-containing protein